MSTAGAAQLAGHPPLTSGRGQFARSRPSHAGAAQGHLAAPPSSCPTQGAAAGPTSFRGGERLGLTARPIASPIDHNHLQLVVTVGEEVGHHATEAVAGEAGLLPLLRHPQALQQAAFPPVVGLQDRGRPVRVRPGRARLVVNGGARGDWCSLCWPQAPNPQRPRQAHRGLGVS